MIKVKFATDNGWLEATTNDLRTFYINGLKSKPVTYYKHPTGQYYLTHNNWEVKIDGIEVAQGYCKL